MTRDEFLLSIDATNEGCQERSTLEGKRAGNETVYDMLRALSDYETTHPESLEIVVTFDAHATKGCKPHFNGDTLYMSIPLRNTEGSLFYAPFIAESYRISSVTVLRCTRVEIVEDTNK